ncbi:MAG: ABC transporter permease [Betaproteobacteria bacterium]|nr:ABC transporter permease [Betaproteobacteria bacterium]
MSAVPLSLPRGLLARAAVLGPLAQAPGRAALSIIAIALGVALGLAVHLINRAAVSEVSAAARSLSGHADLVVQGPADGFSEALYPTLARVPEVAAASPVIEAEARVVGTRETLPILGLDVFRAAALHPVIAAAAGPRGDALFAEDGILLSASAARALHLKAGDTFTVQAGLTRMELRVLDLLPAGAYRQRLGIMDIAAAQWKLGRLGHLQRVDLRLQPGAEREQLRARIQALLPAGVQALTPEDQDAQAASLSRAYRVNLTALSLVALFTGGFLVFATQALAAVRRRRQIALLRALGVTRRLQFLYALTEAGTLGMVGAGAGIALGIAVAAVALKTFGADLGAGYFPGVEPELALTPWEALPFFLAGVVTALAGALVPAWAAASAPPAQALKAGDEERPASPSRGWRTGLILWILAALAIPLPAVNGLPLFGYAAIACILLGAVFVAPFAARTLFARLPVIPHAGYQVATAQLRGTPAQGSLSIAAVLVSFGLMTSMAIMVVSFRASLDTWLEKVLPADLYLRTGQSGDTAFIPPEAQRLIAATPGIARAEFGRGREIFLAPDKPALALIARPMNPERAQKGLALQSAAPVPAGRTPVWVSEAAADLHGLKPGDEVAIPLEGAARPFTVAGIWRDYARQTGAVLIDRDAYVQLTGDGRANVASLWLSPGAAIGEVSAALRARLPAGTDYEIASPAEIRAVSMRIFDRTFAITHLLEAVAIVIGLFGISASFSAQVLARRGEFGMLRHLGMTPGQVGGMLALEGGILGALGVAMGLAAGFVVSLVLIHVVNRQSFHWSLDLHLPWGLLLALGLALVCASAFTAALSGRRAMGPDVLRAVREDW